MCGFACDSAGTPAIEARHRRPPPTPATDASHRRPPEATTRAGTRGRFRGSFLHAPQNTHGTPRRIYRETPPCGVLKGFLLHWFAAMDLSPSRPFPSNRARRSWRPERMRFAALRLAQRIYSSCAPSISSWSSKNCSAIRGMQYGQIMSDFQARERAAHCFRDILKRRITHSSPAEALCTEALPLLEAQSVRFPFGRPAVSLDGRALSFSRAAVTPIELSASAAVSAPHRHI